MMHTVCLREACERHDGVTVIMSHRVSGMAHGASTVERRRAASSDDPAAWPLQRHYKRNGSGMTGGMGSSIWAAMWAAAWAS